MENMGIQKVVEEMKRLNPGIKIEIRDRGYSKFITAACSDLSLLKVPEGYSYNKKNGLNNKGNTTSGIYECFALITLHDYMMHIL